jgi:hypothetical protein
MRAAFPIALICLILAGCSPSGNGIKPIYVAPHQYGSLSCEQIASEAQGIARSASMVAGAPPASTGDGAKVVVWPELALAKSSDATMAALGRLKGQFDSLVLAAQQKSCDLEFQQGGA